MKRTLLERAKLAKRITKKSEDPAWEQFPRAWEAFNAIYSHHRGRRDSEADAIHNAILALLDEAAASSCLAALPTDAVNKLLRLPPGDDRLGPNHPNFRTKTRALAATFRSNVGARERLSALMRIVYQVRCNRIHGEKDPDHWRDRSLVQACALIMTVFLDQLTRILGA